MFNPQQAQPQPQYVTPTLPPAPQSPVRSNPALAFFNFVGARKTTRPELSNAFHSSSLPGRKPGLAARAALGGDANL